MVVNGISEPSTVLGFLDIRKNGGGGGGSVMEKHGLFRGGVVHLFRVQVQI